MKEKYKIMFEPIKIGKLELKNRFVMAPMGAGGMCDKEGAYNERGVEYYVERAKGGTGLIMTGVTKVENEIEKCNMPSMPCPTVNPLHFIKSSIAMTERVHAYGAKIFVQLSAGFGRVSIPSIVGNTAVAPSPIPHRWLENVTCTELTIEQITTYIRKFAESAVIVKKAGFDGVEIHAVHEGYLMDQFAISMFNKRTDEYGGSLRNRLRFATEVVEAIKEACGQDFPVSMRYSPKSFIKNWKRGGLPGEEFVEKGRDMDEGIEAAKILEKAGYDALNSDLGSYDSWYWAHPPMYQKKGLYLPYNEILKKHVSIPIISAGRMEDPELASQAINDGKTDMIGLGRPLLADPEIPNKILAGDFDKVRPCLSCQEGCMGRLQTYATISCAVNPACGRENEYRLHPATSIKNIMVVGGGVAGLETARVSAIRGHKVTLFEKSNKLGGNLLPGGAPDFKEDDILLANWYINELKRLKVEVIYNTIATKDLIIEQNPDVVVLATGSIPKILEIEGSNKVYSAQDILLEKENPGNSTIIIGGGLVGCETALWLVDKGIKVTIVEMQSDILKIGGPLCHANEEMLRDLVAFKKIDIKLGSCVVKAEGNAFTVKTGDKEEVIEADSAIIAIGYSSQKDLYNEIKYDIPKVYLIGDANKVSNIMYAVWDAYEVARNI